MHMMANRPCKYDLFQVPTDTHHIIYRVLVADVDHILFDNRPGIQLRRYIMTGGTNNFYATLVSAMVGPTTRESRQKRMMNIYYLLRVLIDKFITLYLHVSCQHNKIDIVLP